MAAMPVQPMASQRFATSDGWPATATMTPWPTVTPTNHSHSHSHSHSQSHHHSRRPRSPERTSSSIMDGMLQPLGGLLSVSILMARVCVGPFRRHAVSTACIFFRAGCAPANSMPIRSGTSVCVYISRPCYGMGYGYGRVPSRFAAFVVGY